MKEKGLSFSQKEYRTASFLTVGLLVLAACINPSGLEAFDERTQDRKVELQKLIDAPETYVDRYVETEGFPQFIREKIDRDTCFFYDVLKEQTRMEVVETSTTFHELHVTSDLDSPSFLMIEETGDGGCDYMSPYVNVPSFSFSSNPGEMYDTQIEVDGMVREDDSGGYYLEVGEVTEASTE